MRKKYLHHLSIIFLCVPLAFISCEEDNSALPTYAGSPNTSGIVVEQGTFVPQITWLGGYVTVIGVNTGDYAALDSTLLWLNHFPGDKIRYPIEFGTTPDGSEDLTGHYGGQKVDQLIEDSTFTYWVCKESVWNKIAGETGKILKIDSSLTGDDVLVVADTVFLGLVSHTQTAQSIDLYINIENRKPAGRLGVIEVHQPTTSNNPVITWQVTQTDVTDTLISAVGCVLGQQYDIARVLWEVYSADSSVVPPVYGKDNILEQPVRLGQEFDGTRVFYEYPEGGLERDKDYYIWIGNKDWDGSRSRVTKNYAYITFHTW